MSLKEKYTLRNKRRLKQFISFYSILLIVFVVYSSMARYEEASERYTQIDIANWEISVNGEQLTNENNSLTDIIYLIPDTNINEIYPYKVYPGQTGHFDITLDPTNTEVSFEYEVKINLLDSKLSEKMKIIGYSKNPINNSSNQILEDNIVRDTILLNEKDKFTSEDTQIIRFFWEWEQEEIDENESTPYQIVVDMQVRQVL